MKKFIQASAVFGDLLEPSAGKADEDQAKIGQRKVQDVDHARLLMPGPLGAALAFL